ncbi:uncharacterized protein LOC21389893 [Morus notabilis]|uniref:uncharacterized protein LOC21389893 n=1 Tax=Morus notabilis TaxID=981085 RepID=UPI000CED01A9|nr:uncharacterized protein LOC21389893 [Morus notabilis]
MAYIPPHKRHSKYTKTSSLSPELLSPLFNNNLKFRPSRTNFNAQKQRSGKIVYAENSISRWFTVGLDDRNQFPASVHLQPVSLKSVEGKVGEKPLALINSEIANSRGDLETSSRNPWDFIAENVIEDLLSSFEYVRNEMESQKLEEVRPTLVARFGKVLFRGSPPLVNKESGTKDLAYEEALRQMKRSFYTNIPKSYMEFVVEEGAPKIGVEFEQERDVYHVKLADTTRPDSTISCKCSVMKEHGKLQLYKIELNQVRYMVMDISCLEKNLDLRLMLCTKRIVTAPTDDDMKSIRDLIDSAVLDSGVKGGLRWPLGKAISGDKFSVVGVWHTITKSYKNSSMRLKVRDADRFDFRTSTGEDAREIIIKLKREVSELKDQQFDVNLITEMLKDNLRVLWNNVFFYESFLK